MNAMSHEWNSSGFFTQRVSRLEFLKQLCIGSGVLLAGCTPMKIVLGAFPDEFKRDTELRERILRAFVTAVIPGASEDDPQLVRMFTDEYYPFHEYCAFFVADLSSRSNRLFGDRHFDNLSLQERTQVIRDGLSDDVMIVRLYRGAIFLSQVSFYAGIYDDEKGCPLIDFHGTNFGFTDEVMYYAETTRFLAPAATATGNYV